MNKAHEIINSGVLEDYVLGALPDYKMSEVEDYILNFPEVRDYVNTLELSLEKVAKENRVMPPPSNKERLFKSLGKNASSNTKKVATTGTYKGILLGILLSALPFLFLLNSSQKKNQELSNENMLIKEACDKKAMQFAADESLLYFLRHEATQSVPLVNNPAHLVVYHNPVAAQAMVKVQSLPNISTDETFQMWADVEGKMIDMGTFASSREFLKMNFIQNPESFNVTIEPKGGSDHPTVSRLVVSATV